MKPTAFLEVRPLFATIAVAILLLSSALAEPGRIDVRKTKDGFQFTENGKDVLFYRTAPTYLDGLSTHTHYIHPLYDLDGEVLTEDFPKDHVHHRGIFSAWHQNLIGETAVGDSWALKDFSYDIQDVRVLKTNTSSGALRSRVFWKSPLWKDKDGKEKPFVEETTTILVHPATEQARKIDFEIRIAALEDGFRLGGSTDDKGYGGFSVRVRLPKDVAFVGRNGTVEPQRTSVEAGPWLDIFGSFDAGKGKSGVAILCHPSLPGFPERWILRKDRSMQNPVFPGTTPVAVPRDKPVVLRYRLVLHRGDAPAAHLNELQKEYEKEPLAVLEP